MADIVDVSAGIATLLATALYPNGTGQASAIGVGCKIYPGWPNDTALEADLRAGLVHVSIYPQPNIERVTSRYPREWNEATRVESTITATVDDNVVTLGGVATIGHYVTLIAEHSSASYAVTQGDTLADVAAGLAAGFPASGNWFLSPPPTAFWNGGLLAPVSSPLVTASGQTVVFPVGFAERITARTAAPGTVMRELRRQMRGYQICVWAPTPDLRSAAASIVDVALSATEFLTMPDTSCVWLSYRASNDIDDKESSLLYRRDILIWAEYATTQTQPGYPITDLVTQIDVVSGVDGPFEPLPYGANTPGFVFTPEISRHS